MPSPALFIIASLIWGSTFWAITLQLGEVAPAISVLYRFGLASAILFALCYLRRDSLRLSWKAQRWVMLQGFASFGLSYVCTYSSEQYLVSALVSVLFALMVFWTPICSRIAFGTALTWRVWCAAAAAMFGVTLMFYHSIRTAWQEIMAGGSGHFLIGFALALAATLSSSIGNALVVKVRRHSSNVMLTMAWAMLWGCVLVAVWALASGQPWRLPSKPHYWMGLFYLAIFGSVIAFYAYFTLIDRIGAQKAVYIGVVTPVISVLLSIQMEHYRPGLSEWVGMILCLSSVAWVLKSPSVNDVAPKSVSAISFNSSQEAS
ncbi:drug/metabolite transporter (DMT)-like permease [Collimonas sp. PA-H2]|uniref:DMT family transporter n=1 Tax=Collimonas sp. PA-H2 TaxID=1881062 RepID=UPI000BF2FD1F|nr:EamA family transporter [Collimonas sp. PA-H2]PFH04629.1 drug/metabolite transporter (DMT)-like permease [Collimonas sp. PA-H2]